MSDLGTPAELINDLTPQLGGNLDANGFDVEGVSPTEMGYLVGVTSSIQTQLNDTGVRAITYVIDGGGAEITTGIKGDIQIPFACTITEVTMLADQTGSIVVDIWKDAYANFPATVADTITAAAIPTISAALKSQDATLTGWTTSIAAGDHLRYNVNSASGIQQLTITLKVMV